LDDCLTLLLLLLLLQACWQQQQRQQQYLAMHGLTMATDQSPQTQHQQR
jgi:hypothetical protein